MTVWNHKLPEFYYVWAPDYARQVENEPDYKPKDRELLQAFALTTNAGLICDMGCSTGYICLPNGSELLLLTELSNDPLLRE